MQSLEILVHNLSREVLALSNKLAAGEYGTANKTGLNEEPDLEVAPVEKNCLDRVMVTQQTEGDLTTKFLTTSSMKSMNQSRSKSKIG